MLLRSSRSSMSYSNALLLKIRDGIEARKEVKGGLSLDKTAVHERGHSGNGQDLGGSSGKVDERLAKKGRG